MAKAAVLWGPMIFWNQGTQKWSDTPPGMKFSATKMSKMSKFATPETIPSRSATSDQGEIPTQSSCFWFCFYLICVAAISICCWSCHSGCLAMNTFEYIHNVVDEVQCFLHFSPSVSFRFIWIKLIDKMPFWLMKSTIRNESSVFSFTESLFSCTIWMKISTNLSSEGFGNICCLRYPSFPISFHSFSNEIQRFPNKSSMFHSFFHSWWISFRIKSYSLVNVYSLLLKMAINRSLILTNYINMVISHSKMCEFTRKIVTSSLKCMFPT